MMRDGGYGAIVKKRQRKTSILKGIGMYELISDIIPFLFLGTVILTGVSSVVYTKAVANQKEQVTTDTRYVELMMDHVTTLMADLSVAEEEEAEAGFSEVLSRYKGLNQHVTVDLFTKQGAHYHGGASPGGAAAQISGDGLAAFFKSAGNLKNSDFADWGTAEGICWNAVGEYITADPKGFYPITAAKILHASDDGTAAGLLIVSIDPMIFSDIFKDLAKTSAYTVLLDHKYRILYHPDTQKIGKLADEETIRHVEKNAEAEVRQKIGGVNVMVVTDKTEKGAWTVVKIIPMRYFFSNVQALWIIFAGYLCASLTITFTFRKKLFKYFINPINKVTESFRQLQNGSINDVKKLEVLRRDEVGALVELFNSFVEARQDIKTQKILEGQLHQQNEELQRTLQTLKETESQMVQQEKLAGIGQLAAGVAHEINNPLGFVKSNFSVLRKYAQRLENLFKAIDQLRGNAEFAIPCFDQFRRAWEENSIDITRRDLDELIDDTQEGLTRITDIVNALKTFSRSSFLDERNPYDLNEGIKTTLLIATNEIKYNINVSFAPGDLPLVSANGGQINQVLLNIIVNAAQAVKQKKQTEKGRITIWTYVEQDTVCCEIEDNGCGMTAAVKNRIFEPFFTTKGVGEGTGLGLSLAYDIIVNKHGGQLDVMSEVGVGTCFKLIIPIHRKTKDECD